MFLMKKPPENLTREKALELCALLNKEGKECGDTWQYVPLPKGSVHTAKYWHIQVWDSEEYLGTL